MNRNPLSYVPLLHICVCLVASCQDGKEPVVKEHRSLDTLEYLVSNADFIGTVRVRPPAPGEAVRVEHHARVLRVIKPHIMVETNVTIAVGAENGGGFCSVKAGEDYLAFLRVRKEDLLPLTDAAMPKIRNGHVFGIWNRMSGVELVIQGEKESDVVDVITRILLSTPTNAPSTSPEQGQ